MTKMIFYNLGPDKVRQHIQQTNDVGKTWTKYLMVNTEESKNKK